MKGTKLVKGEIEDITIKLGMHVKNLAEMAVKRGDMFTIALSGGSSMEVLSEALLKKEIKEAIDWTKCHIFWVDERCVPENSIQSNYGRAKDLLLDHLDIPENQIHPFDGKINPEEGVISYGKEICEVFSLSQTDKFPKFDLIVLGVGEDGHMASLFPGHPALDEKGQMVLLIEDSPKPPKVRMTLTLPVINNACSIAVVAVGKSKALVIREILSGEKDSDLPASLLSPFDGEIEWFLDNEAGNELGN